MLPALDRELARASHAGALIVYTQDWHPPATPHFEKWPPHCVRHTWGSELHPALLHIKAATVILKGRGNEDGYSAFTSRDPMSGRLSRTALPDVLRTHGIRRVVIAGLATDYCVEQTALDALEAGFDTVVLRDCVRAVDLRPGDGERALAEIARHGGKLALAAELQRPPAARTAQPDVPV